MVRSRRQAARKRLRYGHRTWTVALVALAILSAGAGTAWAHEDEPKQANMLVLQSISLIANGASIDMIAEKISDALSAPDKSGTDLAKVRQAQALVRPGASAADIANAEALLTGAIDIRAASGYGDIPQPGQVSSDRPPYATGAETGTTVVLDELEPRRGISDAGDAVLVALGILLMAVGVLLERRWRPHDTIRQLRHQLVKPGEV